MHEKVVYIGAYFKCIMNIIEKTDITKLCIKCQITCEEKEKFCSNCGKELLIKKKIHNVYDCHEILKHFPDDAFLITYYNRNDETLILLPINLEDEGLAEGINSKEYTNECVSVHKFVNTNVIQDSINLLKKNYANHIEQLEKLCKKVEINFGVIEY